MDCVINPITGRAVKIDSPAGRRALKYNSKNNLNPSHECVINPRTGRAIKKDSPLGRKILKGLIPEAKTKPAPKPKPAYTMYKKPIEPVKPAPKPPPKPPPKPKPAPITIPKKKYDFGNFKTPTREPNSPAERIFLSPQTLGKSEKIKSKKKGVIKSPVAKKEPTPKAKTPKPKTPKPKKQTKEEKEQADFDKKMIESKEKQKREAESLIVIKEAEDRRYKHAIYLRRLEKFINDTENYLNKKSTRAFNELMKEYNDKDYIKTVINAQMFNDFYPTSQKCLDHYEFYPQYFDKEDIILEPTAGLGSIVLWLLKKKVKSKIIATDYDANLNDYLKESFERINGVSILPHIKSNYLKIENDFHRYNPSIIFLNPPFSNGNDKKYYLNFLFKAIYDLKMSEHAHIERQLFFISPQLTPKERENDTINFEDIVISENKKKEIKNMLNISEEEFLELVPEQTTRVKACNDFGGTNAEAVLYQMFLFY